MTDQNNAALDLGTSSGGRAYIAQYFASQLRRHDCSGTSTTSSRPTSSASSLGTSPSCARLACKPASR